MSKRFTKQRLQFTLALLIILILFGCSQSPGSPANVALAAMDAYIDPEIVGKERTEMRRILAALPEYARQDVIHLNDDGTLYTNRKANKGKGKVLTKEGNSDVWADQSGNPYPIPMPSSESNPLPSLESNPSSSGIQTQVLANPVTPQCKLNGTGIEFRMDSKPGGPGGHSTAASIDIGGADVRVFVPSKASGDILVDDPTGYYDTKLKQYVNFGCKRDIQKDNSATSTVIEGYGETPYVYLGGWGGDNANSRVDAGLQFNCPTATTGSYSGYTAALFFSKQNPAKPTEFIAVNADRSTGFLTPNLIELGFQFIPDDAIYPGDQGFSI